MCLGKSGQIFRRHKLLSHRRTGGSAAPDKPFYRRWTTAVSNDLLVTFAEEAITNEKLGAGENTDVLSVSFSANDYVGHRFGPYSQEAMDMTLRVDQQIGKPLDFVDSRVGLGNSIVIFSADHGACRFLSKPRYRISRAAVIRKRPAQGRGKRFAARYAPAKIVRQLITANFQEPGRDRTGFC